MATNYQRDRRFNDGLWSLTQMVARVFDRVTGALAVRSVGQRVIYRKADESELGDDGSLMLRRSFTGADATDPNTSQPDATTTPATVGTQGLDEVVFHVAIGAGINEVDVQVWAKTDAHVDGTTGTAWVWVLIDEFTTVTSHREYRAPVGQRECFLRISRFVGAGTAILRATAL